MNDATPAQNRTLAASGAESGLPTDQRSREDRYAEVIFVDEPCSKPWKWESCHTHSDDWVPGREGLCGYALDAAMRVVAVADAEIAAQVEAAVSVVRAERDEARETNDRLNRRAQTAEAAIHELTNGTGRTKLRPLAAEMWARCQTVHERGCSRAESAEAELRALREGLEALADRWGRLGRVALSADDVHGHNAYLAARRDLRALLAPSPAEGTGEADEWHQHVDPWQDTPPAPVSSGEAGHIHRFERFSRVIEACCDSMHYFCDCGAKEPCAQPSGGGS